MPAEQLSGTIVVIIIAIGVQGCIMLTIFAKRQIVRFALRNRRGPHSSLGQGAPKPLRRDIERCLDYVPYIRFEPQRGDGRDPRSKALELYAHFEREMATSYSCNYSRLPGTNVRAFLLRCTNGPLAGVDPRELHLVCDEYEHARHRFEPFGQAELAGFGARLEVLRAALAANRLVKPHPSPQPMPATALNSTGSGEKSKSAAYRRAIRITRGPTTNAVGDQVAVRGGGGDGGQTRTAGAENAAAAV